MHHIKQQEKYWQQILERLSALMRILAMHNLSFRGSHDNLHRSGNGIFLKLIEYLALFDPLMNEHLRKIQDSETCVHYLGKDIQKKLVLLLVNAIKKEILAATHVSKYYSIILDCTCDVSHVQQMTMILRFVDIPSDTDNCEPESRIQKYIVGFVPIRDTTGAHITGVILHQLQEMSLLVIATCGQGYDNGNNMKGK
ncbi:zinc finger MYM-type protein 1-like [Tachypleus tridentatus]|uniref:zinc finger MYM-type protein 1-like n=1 Tax=Tachypleus tridentatus TaxID=6853 RepID=UPI003FD5B8DC